MTMFFMHTGKIMIAPSDVVLYNVAASIAQFLKRYNLTFCSNLLYLFVCYVVYILVSMQ